MTIPSNFDLYKLALIPGRLEQWIKNPGMGFIGYSQDLMRARTGVYVAVLFSSCILLYCIRRTKAETKKRAFVSSLMVLSATLYRLVQVVTAVRNQYLFENFEIENISKAMKF